MMRSLFSGVSGLKNHQTRMDVIGNNISNVNTTGFKSGRVTFVDSLNQTLTGASSATENKGGTNPKQIGLGSAVSTVDTIFTDGSIQSTGKNTDLCLSGSGLFVVKDSTGTYFTRNGAFEFDEAGNYVMPGSGLFVQGWMGSNGNLDTNGTPGNISIPAGKSMPSKATQTATYVNNLDSAALTIADISYTAKDGSTVKVGTATEPTIEIKVSDGTNTYTVSKLSSLYKNNYTTNDAYIDSLEDHKINKLTSVTNGDIKLTLSTGYLVPSSVIVDSKATDSYAIGDKYTETKTIDTNGVYEDSAAGTVKLTFTDGTSVTIPKPQTGGLYKDGDNFTFEGTISQMDASVGVEVDMDGYPSSSANPLAANPYVLLAQNVDATTGHMTVKSANDMCGVYSTSTLTVDAIGRVAPEVSEDSVVVDGSEIISATLTLSNGTKQNVTTGMYTIGHSTPISTTFTAYDSEGNAHVVPILIEKVEANEWQLTLANNREGVTEIREADGTLTTLKMPTATLTFTEQGAYMDGGAAVDMSYSDGNGAASATVIIDLSNLTQYSGSSTINASADGNAAGTLKSVSIDSSGVISGTYTNGIVQSEAQVAIAQFNNAAGLTKNGSSLYTKSNNSGEPNIKTAEKLGVTITPSALEMSNVDIANEFSDMIITQRGFQSNSKIITVSDEMLETLINMKR